MLVNAYLNKEPRDINMAPSWESKEIHVNNPVKAAFKKTAGKKGENRNKKQHAKLIKKKTTETAV
jgi:hypothetical protein